MRPFVFCFATFVTWWWTGPGDGPCHRDLHDDSSRPGTAAAVILVALAVVVFVAGAVKLLQGDVVVGLVLMVVGLLIGPGGYSIWH